MNTKKAQGKSMLYDYKERETNMSTEIEGVQVEQEQTEAKEEPVKTYTDEEVNEIINKRLAKWQKSQEKAVNEAVKKVEEAQKLAQMTEKEKADYERAELEKELKALKAEKAHTEMMRTARQMLKSDGLTASDDILNVLVAEDAESTAKAIKAFSAMYQQAVNDGIKEALKGGTPHKGGASTITKEEIMAIKNPNKRLEAIRNNIELFKG